MTHFLAIDGGNSKTDVLVGTDEGKILRVPREATEPVTRTSDSTRRWPDSAPWSPSSPPNLGWGPDPATWRSTGPTSSWPEPTCPSRWNSSAAAGSTGGPRTSGWTTTRSPCCADRHRQPGRGGGGVWRRHRPCRPGSVSWRPLPPPLSALSGDWGGGEHLATKALRTRWGEGGRGSATALSQAEAAHFGQSTSRGRGLRPAPRPARPRPAPRTPARCCSTVAAAGDPVASARFRRAEEIVALATVAVPAGPGPCSARRSMWFLGGGVLRACHPLLIGPVSPGINAVAEQGHWPSPWWNSRPGCSEQARHCPYRTRTGLHRPRALRASW